MSFRRDVSLRNDISVRNGVDLRIDQLHLQLPASLGTRRFHIAQLLRTELAKLEWPQGNWPSLTIADTNIVSRHSDIRIARNIAQKINEAAIQRSRLGANA